MSESKNLWGGRFTGKADERFTEFNRSFGFDRKLFEVDVRASLAHCEGLRGAGVLTEAEAKASAMGWIKFSVAPERTRVISMSYRQRMFTHLSKPGWWS